MGSASTRGREKISSFEADLVRSMRCGLITVDSSGLVRSINERAAAILDVDAGKAPGRHVGEVLAAQPHLAELLAKVADLATLPERAETEIRLSGGESRILGYTLSRVVSDGGELRGAALFFKDLTPIEQEAQRERLRERLASLGMMAASLAHEIRNPLAALDVTTTLLRRRIGGSHPASGMVLTLQEQIRRLSGTVSASLEYIRPLKLNRIRGSITQALDEALRQVIPAEGSARVEILRHFVGNIPAVEFDPVHLREALLNILRNAQEAMSERGGVLRVAVEPVGAREGEDVAGGWVQLRISDTGQGIPEEIRNKIFNPFFSTKPQGSGLGLAWSRKVIDAHGGLIDVSSHAGEGSTFIIRIPVSEAATQQRPRR